MQLSHTPSSIVRDVVHKASDKSFDGECDATFNTEPEVEILCGTPSADGPPPQTKVTLVSHTPCWA